MHSFRIHTPESAPTASRSSLAALEQGLTFVPNLAAVMAESPPLINGFVELRGLLARGELSAAERELIAIAVSVENDCTYCVAAHSTFALMAGADAAAVAATRQGGEPEAERAAALVAFARQMVAERGHVPPEDMEALLRRGLSHSAVLEAIAQIGHTTIANFAHNLTAAPLDTAFAAQAWERAAA
jgi:uncharacterized peroxidase-related enzyme